MCELRPGVPIQDERRGRGHPLHEPAPDVPCTAPGPHPEDDANGFALAGKGSSHPLAERLLAAVFEVLGEIRRQLRLQRLVLRGPRRRAQRIDEPALSGGFASTQRIGELREGWCLGILRLEAGERGGERRGQSRRRPTGRNRRTRIDERLGLWRADGRASSREDKDGSREQGNPGAEHALVLSTITR